MWVGESPEFRGLMNFKARGSRVRGETRFSVNGTVPVKRPVTANPRKSKRTRSVQASSRGECPQTREGQSLSPFPIASSIHDSPRNLTLVQPELNPTKPSRRATLSPSG